MKLYRVRYQRWTVDFEGTSFEGHGGFQFFSSKQQAEREVARGLRVIQRLQKSKHPEPTLGGCFAEGVEEVNLTPTRKPLIAFLNKYASHPDNG